MDSPDPQDASPFFTRLPVEVRRLVFTHCLRAHGLRQHLYFEQRVFRAWPCHAEETEFAPSEWAFLNDATEDAESAIKRWDRASVMSNAMGVHTGCRSRFLRHVNIRSQPRVWSPLAVLPRVCKSFYHEAGEAKDNEVTFILHHVPHRFFGSFPAIRTRSLVLYYQMEYDWVVNVTRSTVHYLNMELKAWDSFWTLVSRMPRLRVLDVWLDYDRSYPSFQSVDEHRLCEPLRRVALPDKDDFVLRLPEIPSEKEPEDAAESDNTPDGPESPAPASTYLDAADESGLPFRIVRSPRPPRHALDFWMSNMVREHGSSAMIFLNAP